MSFDLQDRLFERILVLFPKKAVAAERLSDLLNVGKDAVYRRLRGDTLLTPDEIGMLATEFNISLDALIFDRTDTVFFTFNPFSRAVRNFEDYMGGVYEKMAFLGKTPDLTAYYSASEIPLFYYCFIPEIISFKLYIWGRTVWDIEYLYHKKFNFDLIPYPTLQLGNKLANIYKGLPCTELWSLNTMDNTLNQIEYVAGAALFEHREDALLLCDKIDALADHLKYMAETGKKFTVEERPESSNTPYHLYHNEMIYTNNTILAVTPTQKFLFVTHGNPNYLTSSDPVLSDFMEHLFHQIIARCNSISGHDERGREFFFNRLKEKIARTRRRIEALEW